MVEWAGLANRAAKEEMPMRPMLTIAVLISWLVYSPSSTPQSPTVTNNILFRTFLVKADKEAGTIFSVDVDGREYWITAKHIITGAKHPPYGTVDAKTVSLSILPQLDTSKQWFVATFTVIDPGKDIDIVVLAPPKPLLPPTIIQTAKMTGESIALGGDCEFVGFPYGTGWAAKFEAGVVRMPFIKHCTLSGIVTSEGAEPKPVILVLDGINNEGFSGGPVVYGAGTSQQVIGVISGLRREPIDVVPLPLTPNRPEPKEAALANSGFIFAYGIKSAVDAINKNPIGPKRTSP